MKIKSHNCTNIEQIMGYEEMLARQYFAALSKMIKEDFKFSGEINVHHEMHLIR